MARTIMHIDLDAFFVSVEQALNPELQGKPVVVGGSADKRGVVACASYEARAFGLHAGMPLTTASRLCPQATFIEGSFPKYRDASQRFMAILADFSPSLEPVSLDEVYLDATGFESIYGSIWQMAVAIKQRIRDELGLCSSVGIASCKVVAKIAAELSKPDGLLEIARGEERSFLAPLPIAKLPGVGKKTEQVLSGLGIDTIGKLSVMPLSALKSRFGASGELLHRYANGIDNREVEPPGAAKSISRETTFGKDTKDRSLLEATLRYLSERVGAELRRRGRQARCVTLKLRYADFTTITRSRTLKQASNTDQTIFDTGLELLNKALAQEKQPVRLIGIGVSNLVEPGRQLDMFDSSAQRLEQLNIAIDRIRDKYGFTAIQTGRTLQLKEIFPTSGEDYTLQTPSLSR
ncbi:DNA polymerase IV [Dehalococcoidia bacterium]|nr:DNA polymerase IV [Dehalococcoidia bacterium]